MRISHISIVLTLAAVGVVDAAYLSYSRLTQDALSCNILEGCSVVAFSPHSLLFGVIPLSYLGLFFYLVTLVLGIAYLRSANRTMRAALMAAGSLGFLFSMYFLYVQAFIIKAFCVYCVLSSVVTTAIFLVLIHLWFSRPRTFIPTL